MHARHVPETVFYRWAIRELASHPDAAHEIGAAGRTRVIRDFGWPRVAERLEAIYTDVVDRGGRR